MSEEMPGSRVSSMYRQQIGEKPDWKTAEEWAKVHDAMSPEEHRELKAKQRHEGKVPVMHPWWTPEAICGKCGETFNLHYWPSEGGRCTIDKDGPAFERLAEPTSYGRIAGGGAFPRAAKEKAGLDVPQVREAVGGQRHPCELSDAELESLKPIPGMKVLTEYDRIRNTPTTIEPDWIRGTMGVHEMGFRAWHILDKVKRLLADGVPGPTVRELIEHMESKP